jgi:hypothetical protein
VLITLLLLEVAVEKALWQPLFVAAAAAQAVIVHLQIRR